MCENKLWRIDVQNTDGKVKNLQVQRNDIWGKKSTVGGVLFPVYLLDQIGSVNATGSAAATALARDSELTGAIQKSLVDSVGTWQLTQAGQKLTASFTFFRIEGDFSS